MNAKAKKTSTVEAARAQLAADEERLHNAERALEATVEQNATAADADDAALSRLAAKRAAAEARVQALAARVGRDGEDVAAEEERAARVLRKEREAELVRLRGEIVERDAAATQEIIAMRGRIKQIAREQQDRVGRLNVLERLLRPDAVPSKPSYWATEAQPGCEFTAAAGHFEIDRVAQRETVQARLAAQRL